jgi:putative flippase GtrA
VEPSPTALPRQAFVYLLAGLAQLALDSAVFVASTALGVPVPAGNVAGRVAGACLGFWLHGRFTFADDGRPRLRGRHLFRFVVAWLALTALSTVAVAQVAAAAGLQWSWVAKPVVELVLAVIGFVVFRNWVFTRN